MIEFAWSVPPTGFEWIDAREFTGANQCFRVPIRVLVKRLADAPPRLYEPFQETGLFRMFADAPATEDGLLTFANRFGFLGGRFPLPIDRPVGPDDSDYVDDVGEPFDSWVDEVGRMREAVTLREVCEHGDRDLLSKHITWPGPFYHGSAGPTDALGFSRPPMSFLVVSNQQVLEPGDFLQAGWIALQQIINAKLQQHGASPRIVWDMRRRRPDLVLRVVPNSLVAALWVQLAQAVTGRKKYVECQQCGKWFELATEKRTDAKFCTNACRFKAYRARQSEACALHEQGVSVEEIAARLGSRLEAVKGWIQQ